DNFSAVGVHSFYNPGLNYCDKATDIANRLDWINSNSKYLVDIPPNSVKQLIEDIANDLKSLDAVFAELEFSLPVVCKDFDTKYDWKEAFIQSSYLYLQACGSNSNDPYSDGIHLRWSLLKEIGDNHIPKGDLANTGNSNYAD